MDPVPWITAFAALPITALTFAPVSSFRIPMLVGALTVALLIKPIRQPAPRTTTIMPRSPHTPRLSDDVARTLYQEGRRQGEAVTKLADELSRGALAETPGIAPLHCVADKIIPYRARFDPDAA